jgi:hypothetical protein
MFALRRSLLILMTWIIADSCIEMQQQSQSGRYTRQVVWERVHMYTRPRATVRGVRYTMLVYLSIFVLYILFIQQWESELLVPPRPCDSCYTDYMVHPAIRPRRRGPSNRTDMPSYPLIQSARRCNSRPYNLHTNEQRGVVQSRDVSEVT